MKELEDSQMTLRLLAFVFFVFCMDNWKDGVAIYEMQKTMREQDLGF